MFYTKQIRDAIRDEFPAPDEQEIRIAIRVCWREDRSALTLLDTIGFTASRTKRLERLARFLAAEKERLA